MNENDFDSLTGKFEEFLKFQEPKFTEDEIDKTLSLWFRTMPEKAIFSLLHYDSSLESKVQHALSSLQPEQDINFDSLIEITKQYHSFRDLFRMVLVDLTYRMVVNIYDMPIPQAGFQRGTVDDPFNPKRSD